MNSLILLTIYRAVHKSNLIVVSLQVEGLNKKVYKNAIFTPVDTWIFYNLDFILTQSVGNLYFNEAKTLYYIIMKVMSTETLEILSNLIFWLKVGYLKLFLNQTKQCTLHIKVGKICIHGSRVSKLLSANRSLDCNQFAHKIAIRIVFHWIMGLYIFIW